MFNYVIALFLSTFSCNKNNTKLENTQKEFINRNIKAIKEGDKNETEKFIEENIGHTNDKNQDALMVIVENFGNSSDKIDFKVFSDLITENLKNFDKEHKDSNKNNLLHYIVRRNSSELLENLVKDKNFKELVEKLKFEINDNSRGEGQSPLSLAIDKGALKFLSLMNVSELGKLRERDVKVLLTQPIDGKGNTIIMKAMIEDSKIIESAEETITSYIIDLIFPGTFKKGNLKKTKTGKKEKKKREKEDEEIREILEIPQEESSTNKEEVDQLWKEALNRTNEDGNTLLFLAIKLDSKIINYFIKLYEKNNVLKKNLEVYNSEKRDILSEAFLQNADEKIIEKLIEKGASPILINLEGESPISLAIKNSQADQKDLIIKILKLRPSTEAPLYLNSGINIKNDTPLLVAIKALNNFLIDEIIKNKANLNIINNEDENAVFLAIQNKREEILKKLIRAGANVSEKVKGEYLIIWAAKSKYSETIEILLASKAPFDSVKKRVGKKLAKAFGILILDSLQIGINIGTSAPIINFEDAIKSLIPKKDTLLTEEQRKEAYKLISKIAFEGKWLLNSEATDGYTLRAFQKALKEFENFYGSLHSKIDKFIKKQKEIANKRIRKDNILEILKKFLELNNEINNLVKECNNLKIKLEKFRNEHFESSDFENRKNNINTRKLAEDFIELKDEYKNFIKNKLKIEENLEFLNSELNSVENPLRSSLEFLPS